jgi:hypothetical protein
MGNDELWSTGDANTSEELDCSDVMPLFLSLACWHRLLTLSLLAL